MFNLSKQDLEKNKATNTATEIFQQPEVWQEMIDSLLENSDATRGFIKSIYEKHDAVRVIFTGAGTSAFAGDTLVPELRRQSQGHVQFESIATTDLVSNPTEFLYKETPTILVSLDRKSTRLNSSHVASSYAVFCLKKK